MGNIAIARDLPGAAYAEVGTETGELGTAMFEWYELGQPSAGRLKMAWLMGLVTGCGSIAGVVLHGQGASSLIVRANTESEDRHFEFAYAADAVRISIYDARGQLVAATSGAWPGFAPLLQRLALRAPDALGEAALALTLPAGAYTIHTKRLLPTPGAVMLEIVER